MASRATHVLLLGLATTTALFDWSDKHKECVHWADIGECDNNPAFMKRECARSCSSVPQDAGGTYECQQLIAAGGCERDPAVALDRCRASCYRHRRTNLTDDTEGNCWYWGTDGECVANAEWMAKSCPRSCRKLEACKTDPGSSICAEPFECPLERDRAEEETCRKRARNGECRSGSIWNGRSALLQCAYTCAVLDPPSASKTVTRPMVKRSAYIDAHVPRHSPSRCHHVGMRDALLSASCPNHAEDDPNPWRRRWRNCPQPAAQARYEMTPRIFPSEVPPVATLPEKARGWLEQGWPESVSPQPPPITLQVVHHSPRVRLLHNFVSPAEAQHLIEIASPGYHRSSTARAGSDNVRTSNSATLNSEDPVVSAVRQRISFYCGYPETNIEPLQAVRYHVGEFYKPHHDYYNACETLAAGNRHFTFLIYLNEVEAGGSTSFPMLNISVTPKAYSALVFNNCLDNGEPDERSLHEGEPPSAGVKYAINGWVRSKSLSGGPAIQIAGRRS